MSYNNTFYLHFVTDLRRVVFCVSHKDTTGAKAFFDHAHKIYEDKLKQIIDSESKELRIDELWLNIYTKNFPESAAEQNKICEKLLTLSSMIFLRTTKNMSIHPNQSALGTVISSSASTV